MLIKTKFRFSDVFFGMMLAVAIFAMGSLFENREPNNGTPNNQTNSSAQEPSAPVTYWVIFGTKYASADVLTALLVIATIGLGITTAWGIYSQRRETKILQRAYLNVLPAGIEPWTSDKDKLACDVWFINVGNLPATKVSWEFRPRLGRDVTFKPEQAVITEQNTNIVAPRTKIRKGAGPAKAVDALKTAELARFRSETTGDQQCWLYIWGSVGYNDGFRDGRRTDFCYRYNLKGTEGTTISVRHARQHEYGNGTDESG